MINVDAFFNDSTVNVFTDASIKNHGQITESIAGAIIVRGTEDFKEQCYTRLLPSTNNEGEIYAIYMGILKCVEIKNICNGKYTTFNIFSDSRISVYGLREWYLAWIKNSREAFSDKLINSSGEEVKNQQLFIQCFNTILNNGIHINLYHIRGHINIKSKKDRKKFIKDFMESNNITDIPSDNLIDALIHYNDIVDTTSRALLLPRGKSAKIQTITAINKNIPCNEFQGLKIKSEYLFTHEMCKITKEKRKYQQLIRTTTNFNNKK